MSYSRGEEELALHLRAHAELPPARRQHPFAEHLGRDWRADFAWPHERLPGGLIVEVVGRQHGIKGRMVADMERLNVAQIEGWTVLQFTPTQVTSGMAIDAIRAWLLPDRGWLLDILQQRNEPSAMVRRASERASGSEQP